MLGTTPLVFSPRGKHSVISCEPFAPGTTRSAGPRLPPATARNINGTEGSQLTEWSEGKALHGPKDALARRSRRPRSKNFRGSVDRQPSADSDTDPQHHPALITTPHRDHGSLHSPNRKFNTSHTTPETTTPNLTTDPLPPSPRSRVLRKVVSSNTTGRVITRPLYGIALTGRGESECPSPLDW